MKRCFSSPEHENLYRQTSIWLRRSAGLAAWLWLTSMAEAQPTYTPIPLDNPTPQADARFAEAVAGVGDVNGDGVTDLLVGAPQQFLAGNINQGRAFVFSGTDASPLLALDTPTPDSGAGFGEVVAGIGDVDGDGAPDFLVGAPSHDVGGNVRQGRAFVFVSTPPPPGTDGAMLPLVPASPRVPLPCNSARCRVPVTCNLAAALGTPCTNRIDLFVRAPRRLAEDAAARQRRIRFAFINATSVPPGQTANVRLRVTRLGRRIVRTSRANRLRGVLEIRNAPGTIIDTTRVRIRLRRR